MLGLEAVGWAVSGKEESDSATLGLVSLGLVASGLVALLCVCFDGRVCKGYFF